MSAEIQVNRVEDWLNKWKNILDDSTKGDKESMMTLIFLALLERQNVRSSYQDIADELKRHGVITGEVDLGALRNGMFQLVKALKTHQIFRIKKEKRGKESLYSLKKARQVSTLTNSASGGKIVNVLDQGFRSSRGFLAERLMRDRRLPFYGIYTPMRAVARWLLYSEDEAKTRSQYEAQECERLLEAWLSKYRGQNISLIGLGVGEGIGEIEILDKLLSEKYEFKTIHYCAIDTNVHFLVDHVERLNDKFQAQIEERRLICGVVCGNFLTNFSGLIQNLRDEFVNRGELDDLQSGFLPNTSGTLISTLGNVFGNFEQRASEWTYFQPILEGLKGYDLAFLLGVAVEQTEKKGAKEVPISEPYPRDIDELLLATPRDLTHERELLKSHQPKESKEVAEFLLPIDEGEKVKRCPNVERADYQGDGLVRGAHVTGGIYEFLYTTQWDLSMNIGDEELLIPQGTNLLLYNIIKFNIKDLRDFLMSKGLSVSEDIRPLEFLSGNVKRLYAAIALATSNLTDKK